MKAPRGRVIVRDLSNHKRQVVTVTDVRTAYTQIYWSMQSCVKDLKRLSAMGIRVDYHLPQPSAVSA